MEELKLEYYFAHLNEFEHSELFEGCIYPWEALAKIKSVIDEKVE